MFAKKMYARVAGLIPRGLSVFLVLAFLTAYLPQPALAATNACSTNYVVQSGDTLSAIAATYNVTVQALADANDLKDPYLIYVGQTLCIPGSTTSTTSTSSSATGATFSVTRSKNIITIATSNFPAKNVYYVKVDNASERGYKWTKIGRLRTRKTGEVSVSYRLPRAVRAYSNFTICLKNATTDDLICKVFTNLN